MAFTQWPRPMPRPRGRPPRLEPFRSSPVKGSEKPERVKDMKRTALALTTAVTIGMTALTATSPAEARWRGGGWGPGLAAGLVGAAVIGGIASSAYAYGPGYGYYGGYPAYGYYGGYAPAITATRLPITTAGTLQGPTATAAMVTGPPQMMTDSVRAATILAGDREVYLRKSLNRAVDNSVYRTVCWIFSDGAQLISFRGSRPAQCRDHQLRRRAGTSSQ